MKKKWIVTLVLVFSNFFNLTVVSAQMPPRVINPGRLPFQIEGYTVVQEGNRTKLYQEFSNLPARNIYNSGGIQIEIDWVWSPSDILNSVGGNFNQEAGKEYQLKIKISKGDHFDNQTRFIENLQGPVSQAIIHFPGTVEITGTPRITVDGRTVSQEMIHSLWTMAGFGFPSGSVVSVISGKVINGIAEAIGHRVIDQSHRRFKPSERIEIHDNLNLTRNHQIKQLTWKLGGWDFRDHLTINEAEIIIPIKFNEAGNYDLSFYFNLWGQHRYADRRNPMTTTVRGVYHSFRQHVVLKVNVENKSASSGAASLSADDRVFFRNPAIITSANSEIIQNRNTPENPKNISLKFNDGTSNLTAIILQSADFWRGWNSLFDQGQRSSSAAGITVNYIPLTSSGYRVLLTTGFQNMWQAYVLLENNVVVTINGPGSDLNYIQRVLDNLNLRNYVSTLNQRTR